MALGSYSYQPLQGNRDITRELVNDLEGTCNDWRKAVDL